MRPLVAAGIALLTFAPLADGADALARHPRNARYLIFRGRPTILVGSGEHYGAVINLDFDQRKYLDTLARDGLNLTRLFVGTYYEKPGDFGIRNNTLAPAPGRAVTPWARSATPGAADGGSKFDLSRWDEAYFERLRGLVREAGKRGIVVEVVLLSSSLNSTTRSRGSPRRPRRGLATAVARTSSRSVAFFSVVYRIAELVAVAERSWSRPAARSRR